MELLAGFALLALIVVAWCALEIGIEQVIEGLFSAIGRLFRRDREWGGSRYVVEERDDERP
jgi:hypothetical protein